VAAEGLRPTPDRIRETLFNWIQAFLPGARCLDLFAGTGALGLEALSRGADEVIFVESNANVATALDAAIHRLGGVRARVIRHDAMVLLDRAPERPFDLVFVDPPYRRGLQRTCLDGLAARGWLAPGGCAYVEEPRASGELIPGAAWEELRCREAGDVRFRLLGLLATDADGTHLPSV